MAKPKKSELEIFFNDRANFHARESIFKHKVIYDLKLAAAERGYHLQSYTTDVDHDGFDLILDDGRNLKKLQLKTVLSCNDVYEWKIHSNIIKPTLIESEEIFHTHLGANYPENQGGVILMKINAFKGGNELECTYLYTDFLIIAAFYHKIFSYSNLNYEKIKQLYEKLTQGYTRKEQEFMEIDKFETEISIFGQYKARGLEPINTDKVKTLLNEKKQEFKEKLDAKEDKEETTENKKNKTAFLKKINNNLNNLDLEDVDFKILKEIITDMSNYSILSCQQQEMVHKNLFLHSNSPDDLLALADFSSKSHSSWRFNLIKVLSYKCKGKYKSLGDDEINWLKSYILEEVNKLLRDDFKLEI
jgi:hypothetical protein